MKILFILSGLIALGLSARWNWWRWPKKGVAILMYHKIGLPPPNSQLSNLWVSQKKFVGQLRYLKEHNIPVITFADYYQMLQEKKVPEKAAIITFDDGYQDNYTEAFPLLKKYGFKAMFFLVSDTIGIINKWHNLATESQQQMLSLEQIKEMQESGMEFGSHTLSHLNLQELSIKNAASQISKSKIALEKALGKPVDIFAYPYGAGAYNPAVKQLVRPAGYKLAVGIKQAINRIGREDYFALKRITVRGDENLFDFYLQITRGKNRL
ncbi:MAG: polysaccharide deacetylase family protein [Elusimicrobia bacterium]|nr:polysaccharide deacetylase family protein [Elusimicrobiota bacterium]